MYIWILLHHKMLMVVNSFNSSCTDADIFFFDRRPVPFGGSRHLRLPRLPRHDRGPVPGGNRSAASCLCTVLRRALYHFATRSPGHLCADINSESEYTPSKQQSTAWTEASDPMQPKWMDMCWPTSCTQWAGSREVTPLPGILFFDA